ncbi:hypothetical protein HU200_030444 [Digitaria exilis]|uniref:Uncharacterized protein n=1 Tax=Digitaria exilis TaxID=1010633 RepID=A0A835BNY0_9POAL|nr:hypothetical protein HU200_030444 [Digitaria exilis]
MDFESIGKLWLSKKNLVINIFTSAALWGLWKLRNFICFQNGHWRDVQSLIQRITGMLIDWKILCPVESMPDFEQKLCKMKYLARRPGRLGS